MPTFPSFLHTNSWWTVAECLARSKRSLSADFQESFYVVEAPTRHSLKRITRQSSALRHPCTPLSAGLTSPALQQVLLSCRSIACPLVILPETGRQSASNGAKQAKSHILSNTEKERELTRSASLATSNQQQNTLSTMNKSTPREPNTLHRIAPDINHENIVIAAPRPRQRRGLRRAESVSNGTGIQRIRRSKTTDGSRTPRIRQAPRRVMSLASPACEPKHHILAPRRSSFRSSSEKPSRRVSFGESAISVVPKSPEDAKHDIWYDQKELRKLRKRTGKMVEEGPTELDKTEDCWRGLETFARQEEERKADIVSDMEQYKLILLVLQKKNCNDLQLLQQQFLSRFTEQGTKAAAEDAAEAFAIYSETMEAEQVQEFFPKAIPGSTSTPVPAPNCAKSDHARVA